MNLVYDKNGFFVSVNDDTFTTTYTSQKANSSLNFTNVEQLSTNAHDKQTNLDLCMSLHAYFSLHVQEKVFWSTSLTFLQIFLTWRRGIITGDLQKKFQNNASSLWHQVKLSIDCRLHIIVITKPQSLTSIISKVKKKLQIEIHISIYIYPSLFN